MQMAGKSYACLYEDSQILVVFKPAGLPVQSAGVGTTDLYSLLMKHLVQERESSRQESGQDRERKRRPDRGRKKATAPERGGLPYLGIVHRLDQPVEGLLVFAKTPKAAADLSAQAQDGRMEKTYLALVSPAEAGRELLKRVRAEGEVLLQDRLIRDGRTNTSRVASKSELGRKEAKEARLLLSLPEAEEAQAEAGRREERPPETGGIRAGGPVTDGTRDRAPLTDGIRAGGSGTGGLKNGKAEDSSDPAGRAGEGGAANGRHEQGRRTGSGERLVRVRLLTGRHHQIRVQLSAAGLPIAGDRKYGAQGPGTAFPALCACRLEFAHPVTGKRMVFQVTPGFA